MDIEYIKEIIQAEIGAVHTAMPGTLIEYDGILATVLPKLPKRLITGKVLPPPQIVKVPMLWPSSDDGDCFITLPMKPGDTVMLFFSERSTEEWFDQNDDAPTDPRRYDLSDCFAYPFPHPKTGIRVVDTENLRMQYGPGFMTIDKQGNVVFDCKNMTIRTSETMDVHNQQSMTVDSRQNIQLESNASLSMKTQSSSLESTSNSIKSNTTINGAVTQTGGMMMSNMVTVSTHKHVETSSITTVPIPAG